MKNPTAWNTNTSAEANQFAYDSATVAYDSATNNYDGVVDTDMSDRELTPLAWEKIEKTPIDWSNTASKSPTVWSAS